ncbi:GFA family protein [Pelagibacteraceae bacterium]|nr:GFA family protein [Pelagibacteraceae bacterium]|tara:strand:+ start:131 stop:493 length:363 start_codon:yes stop_codon:yes gene_type:complete
MKKLKCHCGDVEAEINVSKNLEKILKCNCSICKRKGAIMSMVRNEDFKIIKGKDMLKLYQFHSKIAKHYFCSNCGIYTHHNPRSNPAMTGFNLGCVDEINTFELDNISLIDGLNHPLDKK